MAGKQDCVIVTGAAGALGSAIARHFLKLGAKVAGIDIVDFDPIADPGRRDWVFRTSDLASEGPAAEIFDWIAGKFGAIDLLVNASGSISNEPVIAFHSGRLMAHSTAAWHRVLQSNLTTCFTSSVQAARIMARQSGGTIVNIGSVSAGGNPGQVAYSAAKSGLIGMSVAMARELGPVGIRVNVVSPGFIDVPSTRNALDEAVIHELVSETPLRCLGNPQNVVDAVEMVYRNRFITGAVVPVDGGFVL